MTILLKDDNGNILPEKVQNRVNTFIDNLPKVPWFQPSPTLKKKDVEAQAKFTLKCFGIEADIEYKKITNKEDWASAWDSDSAWDSAWTSARALDSAMAQAFDSARASTWASARALAWDSAWTSARALDSTWASTLASTWDSARARASASAQASEEILLEDNEEFKKKYPNGAFKQLFKLWEMGLYPVGVLKDTGKFTIYIPPSKMEFPKDFE